MSSSQCKGCYHFRWDHADLKPTEHWFWRLFTIRARAGKCRKCSCEQFVFYNPDHTMHPIR